MFGPDEVVTQRLQNLERHLQRENPILLKVVAAFRELDKVAYRMGLLQRTQSYAMMVPWWPLISILGTFSSGKSTFINNYLAFTLQGTGNQAVDDKFTVICHSRENKVHVLPGLSLDADPRFPFYQISEEIEKVTEGEGRRVDAYLQLKTCPSDAVKGKIIIDSPGFDADEQRSSTLRITEHIIDLSDLVLVFFDARHPEPGAMRDTLEHLVANSIVRPDSNKFLYILNQIDATAREDNPEEVFGAWQRALTQYGLTAGRFYTIYASTVALPIEDENLRRRFESKRDADLEAINTRIQQVEIERAYRLVGSLEKTARQIEERFVPLLSDAIARWRKMTLLLDAAVVTLLTALFVVVTVQAGYWHGFSFQPSWWDSFSNNANLQLGIAAIVFAGLCYAHYRLREFAFRRVALWMAGESEGMLERDSLSGAFRKSTRIWRSLFNTAPAGWGRRMRKRLAAIINHTDGCVQELNDRFTNPAGHVATPVEKETSVVRLKAGDGNP